MTRLALPDWYRPLAQLPQSVAADQLSRFTPPAGHQRLSAVLMLFGQASDGEVDVLLTERASGMRSHAGQVAFPGGRIDPEDDGPTGAALREAAEETGLDPTGVVVSGLLPAVYLPPSDYSVVPVLAWWAHPSPVSAGHPDEVARVARISVAALLEPANRFSVHHPSGYVGPGFAAQGWFVWGFTAGLLDRVFALAGWEREWDHDRVRDLGGAA